MVVTPKNKPKAREASLPEPQEALLPTLQEVLLPEPYKALLPKLRDVPLPEPQEVFLPKLQEVPLPEPQEAFLSKLQEVTQSQLQEVPQPKLQEVPQPQLQEVPPPKLLEVPLVRLSKRDDQLVSNISEDLEPTIDLNCTGPCAKSFEETIERLADEDGSPHDADLNDINIFLQTVFQNLSSETRGEFPNSSKKQEFRNLPNGKLKLQQEYLDKMGNDSTGSVLFNLFSPDTLDATINANKSEELNESDDVQYGNIFIYRALNERLAKLKK